MNIEIILLKRKGFEDKNKYYILEWSSIVNYVLERLRLETKDNIKTESIYYLIKIPCFSFTSILYVHLVAINCILSFEASYLFFSMNRNTDYITCINII